jgi:hemicentin
MCLILLPDSVTILNFTALPEILNTVTEINTTAGSTTSVNCTVSGYPPPMVFWQIYGENAMNVTDERFVFVTGDLFSTLIISKTTLEDFGEYTCVAINEEGETRQDFVINVFGTCNNLYFYIHLHVVEWIYKFVSVCELL